MRVSFRERTLALVVPLRGRDKPLSQKTLPWAQNLPPEVIEQCRRWVRALTFVPVDVHEYYAIDSKTGDVIIKNVYDYIRFKPDATISELVAPAPPCTALAKDAGLPISFEGQVLDLNTTTSMGPYSCRQRSLHLSRQGHAQIHK